MLGALLAAACAEVRVRELQAPDTSAPLPTTTTSEAFDFSAVVLPPVEGVTTTTVALGPGSARLFGWVDGPDGRVAGATVRIQRIVGDGVAQLDVLTAEDGTWEVPGVLGGRYRVRAWRAPDLALVEPQIFFLNAGEQRETALQVSQFRGTTVEASWAPSRPWAGDTVLLAVRVAARAVDEEGVVTEVPQPGVEVQLRGSARWQALSPNPVTTEDDGAARWRLECRAPGLHPLAVVLDGVDQLPIDVPECGDPAATTTTTATTTTVPDGGDEGGDDG